MQCLLFLGKRSMIAGCPLPSAQILRFPVERMTADRLHTVKHLGLSSFRKETFPNGERASVRPKLKTKLNFERDQERNSKPASHATRRRESYQWEEVQRTNKNTRVLDCESNSNLNSDCVHSVERNVNSPRVSKENPTGARYASERGKTHRVAGREQIRAR